LEICVAISAHQSANSGLPQAIKRDGGNDADGGKADIQHTLTMWVESQSPLATRGIPSE
jgi:hypothetical protein